MDRDARIALARDYAASLAERFPQIEAIVLGGSTVRGDFLPASDIDLLYFVPADAPSPAVVKHVGNALFIDVEEQPAGLLSDPASLRDPYLSGYLADALVLVDRTGHATAFHTAALAARTDAAYRAIHLASLREPILRNLGQLEAASDSREVLTACRAGAFCLWTMVDYLLVERGMAPGGKRGIRRLRAIDPESAALIEGAGVGLIPAAQDADLVESLDRLLPNKSPFFSMWFDESRWMLAHDYRSDGLFALWIALALHIRYLPEDNPAARRDTEPVARAWLDATGLSDPLSRTRLRDLCTHLTP